MNRRFVGRIVFVLCAGLALGSVQAADKRPFREEDMAALRSARPVAVSPDGETVL
jgi:hypothetical protein